MLVDPTRTPRGRTAFVVVGVVGDIGTGAPALQNVLSSSPDPGHSDATAGVIYLGATTPTAFEAVAYTTYGTRVACGVTSAAAGCTATGG